MSDFQIVKLSDCQTIRLSNCHTLILSNCQNVKFSDCSRLLDTQTVILSDCQIVKLLDWQIIIVSDCQFVSLSNCQTVILSDCQNLRISDCQIVRQLDCQTVRVPDCQIVFFQGRKLTLEEFWKGELTTLQEGAGAGAGAGAVVDILEEEDVILITSLVEQNMPSEAFRLNMKPVWHPGAGDFSKLGRPPACWSFTNCRGNFLNVLVNSCRLMCQAPSKQHLHFEPTKVTNNH